MAKSSKLFVVVPASGIDVTQGFLGCGQVIRLNCRVNTGDVPVKLIYHLAIDCCVVAEVQTTRGTIAVLQKCGVACKFAD